MKYFYIVSLALLWGCQSSPEGAYVYQGRVDADIIRVSAKSAGTLDSLFTDEGLKVKKGELLAVINDERVLARQRAQQAQWDEARANLKASQAQKVQLQKQRDFTRSTLEKTRRMIEGGAATRQQADELATRLEVYQAQIVAADARIEALKSREKQLAAAMALTELDLRDTRVTSPVNGVVLTRLHSADEMVAPGVPLFEVTDLSRVDVLCYVPLKDLPDIQIGRKANIRADGVENPLPGRVTFIADQSEFTPKTILTRETRTTLVYRVKIRVDNRKELLKIGMPVDVTFEE